MATSTEIKQRANALAGKTDVNSITPKEVGGIMYDLASHSENVLRNGGTLGIRKVYESVSAMEADSTNPKDFWGDPIKKGNLVVIYDGTTTGVDNNKIYAFMNPGWQIATHLDAGYAMKAETDAKLSELGSEVNELNLTTKGNAAYGVNIVNGSLVNTGSVFVKRMTNYIPVEFGDTVVFNIKNSNWSNYVYGYQGYSEDKVLNNYFNFSPPQSSSTSNRVIITNESIKYIRFEYGEIDSNGEMIDISSKNVNSSDFEVIIERPKNYSERLELVEEELGGINLNSNDIANVNTSLGLRRVEPYYVEKKLCSLNGDIYNSDNFYSTTPIQFKKGESIRLFVKGSGYCNILQVESKNSTSGTPLLSGLSSDSPADKDSEKEYIYTFEIDALARICNNYSNPLFGLVSPIEEKTKLNTDSVDEVRSEVVQDKCNLFWIDTPYYNNGWDLSGDFPIYISDKVGSKSVEYSLFKYSKKPTYVYVLTEGKDFGQMSYMFVFKDNKGVNIGISSSKYLPVGLAKIQIPSDIPECDFVVMSISGSSSVADPKRNVTLKRIAGFDEDLASIVGEKAQYKEEVTTVFVDGEVINTQFFNYNVKEGDSLKIKYYMNDYSECIDVHQSIGFPGGNDLIKITNTSKSKSSNVLVLNDYDRLWIWGRTTSGSIIEIVRRTKHSLLNVGTITTNKILGNLSTLRESKPYISFIDDDGKADVYNELNPYFSDKKIKYSIAVPSSKLNASGYLTKKQLIELYSQGVEVLSHSNTHGSMLSSLLDDNRLKAECYVPINTFKGLGIDVSDFCFPGGQYDNNSMKIASEYYKRIYLFEQERGEGYNTIENIRNTYIKRHSFRTFSESKSLIDEVAQNNGWLIITTHVNGYGWNGFNELDELIEYAKSKGFVFEQAGGAASKFCNVYEQGQKCLTADLEIIDKA